MVKKRRKLQPKCGREVEEKYSSELSTSPDKPVESAATGAAPMASSSLSRPPPAHNGAQNEPIQCPFCKEPNIRVSHCIEQVLHRTFHTEVLFINRLYFTFLVQFLAQI